SIERARMALAISASIGFSIFTAMSMSFHDGLGLNFLLHSWAHCLVSGSEPKTFRFCCNHRLSLRIIQLVILQSAQKKSRLAMLVTQTGTIVLCRSDIGRIRSLFKEQTGSHNSCKISAA
ncbi:MAG: hypothetical protein AAFW82_06150, partial [Pseudomonadota bacterium]